MAAAAVIAGLGVANAASLKLTGNSLIGWIGTLIHSLANKRQQELPTQGQGPARAELVFADVMTVLQGMAASGAIDKVLPPDSTIRTIIEAVVASGKASGTIAASVPATGALTTPAVQATGLPVGTVLKVQVIA